MTGATFICGGDETPGPRDACPNALHDYPLPTGYTDASEVAYHRLYKRWSNVPLLRLRPIRLDPTPRRRCRSRGGPPH